jgi:hypothetical protein
VPEQATSRRVVTVEWEERTVLFRSQPENQPPTQPLAGSRGSSEKSRVFGALPDPGGCSDRAIPPRVEKTIKSLQQGELP